MKNKFKVGDRVKVSKNYQLSYNKCGVGTVVEVRTDGNRAVYIVQFDDKIFKSSFYSYQLDKLEKLKKDKPIVMVEFRPQDTQPNYKYNVGDKVTLTKEAIEWLKKFDRGQSIKQHMYDTVFEVTKHVTYGGDPAYYLNGVCGVCFVDEDLKPAPHPIYVVGQEVWFTPKTIEQLEKDKVEIGNPTESFKIIGWYYYKSKILYKLDRVNGLYFYEYELTDQKPIRTLTVEQYREEQKKAFKDYMNKCKAEDLRVDWYKVCVNYTMEFCKRHSYKYDPDAWVGGEVGTIIEIADMFVTMDNIRYDVDNNIDPELFEQWYWKSVELYELGVTTYMNYPSYCKGAPDEWTEERMEELRRSKKRLEEAQEDFKRTAVKYQSSDQKLLF